MNLFNLTSRKALFRWPQIVATCLAAMTWVSDAAADQPYAQVKGWSIIAIDYGQGFGCTMQRQHGATDMMLHLKENQWELGIRSRRAPGDATTIEMDIDRFSEILNARVYPGGIAIANVDDSWVKAIAQARFIQASADGGIMREISAQGTAAAISKTRECAVFHGISVPGIAPAPATPKVSGPTGGKYQLYANVRGWEVFTNTPGCTAMRPSEVIVSFNTPPAGGWELQIEDFEGLRSDVAIPAQILVDGQVFLNTFYADNGTIYGNLDLELRKALAAGRQANIIWGHNNLAVGLNGVTAALLKVEECWHKLTGFDASTSSRAGTYAFR